MWFTPKFDRNLLPALAGATPEKVPLIDPKIIEKSFPGRKFFHDQFDGVHDADFEYFRNIDSNFVFCDIGANIGQTIVTLRHLNSRATLHSFEINPVCWSTLQKRSKGYAGSLQFHRFGLGEKPGVFELYVPVNGESAASTLGTLDLKALQTPHITSVLQDMVPGPDWRVMKTRVEVRTFDSLGIAPDFVKIDVEGFEASVLRGMINTIRNKPPVFLIEDTNPQSVQDVLAPLGYLPCGWDRIKKTVHLSHGKHGNSLYIHASEILAMMNGRGKRTAALDIGEGEFENQYAGGLRQPVNDQYITEAFRVFFGVDPNPEQLAMHRKADASRLAMRNRFMRFIIDKK